MNVKYTKQGEKVLVSNQTRYKGISKQVKVMYADTITHWIYASDLTDKKPSS